MWIELLWKFLPVGHFLIFATVSKKWLWFMHRRRYKRTTYYAAICSRSLIEWSDISKLNPSVCANVAAAGDVELLEWAIHNDYAVSLNMYHRIIKEKNLDLLQRVIARQAEYSYRNWMMISKAIEFQSYDILRWMFRKPRQRALFEEIRLWAAKIGVNARECIIRGEDMNLIRYLRFMGIRFREDSFLQNGVQRNNVQLLDMHNNYEYSWRYCYPSMSSCSVAVISWFLDRGYFPERFRWEVLFKFDRIDIIELLQAREYPLYPSFVLYALKPGHIRVIKWAIENGCGMSKAQIFSEIEGLQCNPENEDYYKNYTIVLEYINGSMPFE